MHIRVGLYVKGNLLELSFLANVNSRYRPSVCLSSVIYLSSVTFVRPTQAVQILANISTALGTLAIR